MEGVDLQDVYLYQTNLQHAYLQGAYLNVAHLSYANLSYASLSQANLSHANLSYADLRHTALTRTLLINATLTGALLYGTARDEWAIDGIQCDFICWDEKLFIPDEEEEQWKQEHRVPKDRDFRPGEFEKRYQQSNHFEQDSIADLIQQGENVTVEFKSTLQWNVKRNQQDRELRFECLKTVAAFLNSEGGTLVIGVEDDGTVFGLQRDLSLLGKRQDLDGFEQTLMNLIREYIGAEVARFLHVRFEQIDGKDVCIVEVEKAAKEVYMKAKPQKIFYIRHGNTTVVLEVEKIHGYILDHWK